MMIRVFLGAAALAAAATSTAMADPSDATLWAVTENGLDGLLIDVETGEAWLTGDCMKPIAPVEQSGTAWTSHSVEFVSVGRAGFVLDQTFTLDMGAAPATLTVETVDRGGPQVFPVTIETDCQASSVCRMLSATPVC